jgi:HAE1 family hydrophobic/amphiphilic exporter-1
MSIPEHFIRRPVMTTLVTSAITLFGWMAYERLPVSDLPNVDFPTISVSASLPGASPETMAASVATPLEQQFSSIAGIESMTSTSSLGSTSVTMQFTLDRSIDGAAQDVQSAIAAVQRRLPQDMPSPPSFRKSNPNDDSILLLALSSKTLALSEINELAETVLAQRISTVRRSRSYISKSDASLRPSAFSFSGSGRSIIGASAFSGKSGACVGSMPFSITALHRD